MKKLILQFIAVFSFISIHAQPVYDNNPQSIGQSPNATLTVSNFSVPAGDKRLLVVCAKGHTDISGATFDGNPMTEQVATVMQGNYHLRMYTYLLGDSGSPTSGDVVVSGDFVTNAGVWSYHNVDQTTPVDNATSTLGGSGSNSSSLIVNSEPGDLVCDCMGTADINGPYTLTPNGSQSQVFHESNGFFFFTEVTNAASHKAGAASVSMNWTISPNNQFAHIGMNINVASAGVGPLPVELLTFRGVAEEHSIDLIWKTATEKDNEGFDIQRSADGIKWQTIGFSPGYGTTIEQQEYTFTDDNPFNGTNYYRLKQFDFDGAFEYSDVVSVDFSSSKDLSLSNLKIAPNPIYNGTLTLRLADADFESGFVEIFSTNGQRVFTQKIENLNTTLNVQDLPKGIYWLNLTTGKERVQRKIIVQ